MALMKERPQGIRHYKVWGHEFNKAVPLSALLDLLFFGA